MSLTSTLIQNAKLQLTLNPPILAPSSEVISINLPINFTSVANVQTFSGSYTPNNDTLVIASSIPSNQAPNFLLLISDAQLNLTVMSGVSNIILASPVNKVFFTTLTPSSGYAISEILFNGQTSDLNPMPQNQLVNYTLIIGQATIS